jgi:iron-sulfur cluster repair protein YtfE (RIC family)
MYASLSNLSPSITAMIRMDHTHAMAVFHRYKATTSDARKSALVRNVCLALEVHAQLEEEIFYPALRQAGVGGEALEKSEPEHVEMRALIERLRASQPGEPGFDDTFFALMRTVIHHVADEESILLPLAERVMAERLSEFGMQMTKRRMQLIAPHGRELAVTTAQSFPVLTTALAGFAVAVGAVLISTRMRRLSPRP